MAAEVNHGSVLPVGSLTKKCHPPTIPAKMMTYYRRKRVRKNGKKFLHRTVINQKNKTMTNIFLRQICAAM